MIKNSRRKNIVTESLRTESFSLGGKDLARLLMAKLFSLDGAALLKIYLTLMKRIKGIK